MIGNAESRQAPTSVPPVMLMIGSRPRPTFSNSQRQDSGSHGSPVEARIRSRLRSCDRTGSTPCLIRARIKRRRDAQDRHPVPLDHRPEPVGGRVVGHAFGEDDGPSRGQRADQLPGAHDPAQVGDPVEHVVRVHVGLVGHLLRDLDQEPAVHVDRPLGPARGARGVR